MDAWATLCGRVIIDQQTGLASLIDLIDQIDAAMMLPEAAPLVLRMTVATQWRRVGDDAGTVVRQRVVFRRSGDDQEIMTSPEQDLDLRTKHLGLVITFIPFVMVNAYDQYRFDVERFQDGVWARAAWTGLMIRQPQP